MVQGSLFIHLIFTSGNLQQDEEQNSNTGWQKLTEKYKISATLIVLCRTGYRKDRLETFKRPLTQIYSVFKFTELNHEAQFVLMFLKTDCFFSEQSISLGIKKKNYDIVLQYQWMTPSFRSCDARYCQAAQIKYTGEFMNREHWYI